MEGEGEAETEDGTDEEGREHQLLLQVHLHPVLTQGGTRQEIHHHTYEGYATWERERERVIIIVYIFVIIIKCRESMWVEDNE